MQTGGWSSRALRLCSPRAALPQFLGCLVGLGAAFCVSLLSVSLAAQTARKDAIRILPVVDQNDIRFVHVTSAEGQPHSRISQITQDDLGFLWLTTQDGLQRFDGYHYREFRHDPKTSISGSNSLSIYKARTGKLWIGTDRSLGSYDPLTEKFTPYPFGPSAGIQSSIFDINEDRDGKVWLATNRGLMRLDPATRQQIEYHSRPDDPTSLSGDHVRTTFEQRDGTFWVGGTEGLDVFDRRTGRVTQHIPLPKDFPRPGLLNPNLEISFCEDHAGVLWVGFSYGYGLATVDRSASTLHFYSLDGTGTDNTLQSGARDLYEDEDGTLWIGTTASGLLKLDSPRTHLVRYSNNPSDPDSLSSDQINSLFEDREGNIWVGTTGGWVNRFSRRALPFRRYRHSAGDPHSLDSNYCSAVFQDSRGMIWIGSIRSLTRIDPKTGKYTFYRTAGGAGNLSSTWVVSIAEDREGNLWFGTVGGGLNRLDPKSGKFQAFQHDSADPRSLSAGTVIAIYVDRQGTVWAGTDEGLNAFDPRTQSFRIYKGDRLEGNRYRSIIDDPAGGLWLGTLGSGLQHLDPDTGHFTSYEQTTEKRSLSSNDVNGLWVDHAGTLWLATGSGLDRFDPKAQSFHVYTQEDGLPDSSLSSVVEDSHGDLWIGTNNGLSRFDPNTEKFRNYSVSDGLLGNEFYNYASAYKSKTGELFFNNYAGVISFFPEDVVDNPYVPPVLLTDFLLFSKSVEIGGKSPLQQSISVTKSLVLDHRQSILSFEFSALSYANPDRNRYRYMLEGLENHWNESDATRRFVTYTTLPPGEYVFRVQGSNNRGVWNEVGVALKIRILPPWWGTWWFRSAAAFVLLSLASLIYFLRMRRIKRHNLELMALNEDLRRSEHELQESESKLAEAQRVARVGHFLYDLTSQQLIWSDETYRIFGLQPGNGAVTREQLLAQMPPQDQLLVLGGIDQVMETAAPFSAEHRVIRPSGEERIVHVQGGIRVGASGARQIFGTIQDITERKRADEELRRLYEEMEERVIQRTAQLATVNNELEAFTSSVSHDLRAPLRHIAGFSKILLEEHSASVGTDAQELLIRIEKETSRMGHLVDDLLLLSRLGRQEMQFRPVPLDQVVRDVIQDLILDCQDRKVEWKISSLPTVKGDPALLRQVFANLISNALKFTKPRSLASIEIGRTERNGLQAIFVRDNGVGFDMKYVDKLFGVFQRLHRADQFEGNGVGLATVQRIIRKHGGTIWAEAELGKGATFYFTCGG